MPKGFVPSKRSIETEMHTTEGSTQKKMKLETNVSQGYSAVAQRIMVNQKYQ